MPLPPLRFNPATVQSADDPASFVTPFETYCEEVAPTAYFPSEEATLFHAWRARTGVPLPAWPGSTGADPESG